MQIFVFDLLPYRVHLDKLETGSALPYPLGKAHFDANEAVKTYAEHLDAWEELDKLGYDGVGFNEHHTSPYGLMNSPNLMASAASQRTKKLKLLIYGNLIPLHNPLRMAEELAMIDCMSNGRLIAGIARGIPREYQVHNVPLSESRARFEEAYDIITKAWSEDVFSYQGKFWSYNNVAMWPRPVQRPHPPILLGGGAPAALRRAGRLADGWVSSSGADLTTIGEPMRVVREAAAAAGRDPDALRFICRGSVRVRQAGAADRRPLTGSLDEIRADLDVLAGQGVSEVFVDLNFDPQVGSPDADPAESMARAERVLDVLAPEPA